MVAEVFDLALGLNNKNPKELVFEAFLKQLRDTYSNIGKPSRILDAVRSSPTNFVGELIKSCDSQGGTEYQQVAIIVWKKVNKETVLQILLIKL